MICEKEQKGVYVELSMGGSVLVRFQVHEDDMITRDDNWWNSLLVPYIELTSVSSVKEALKMTFTIFGLNDGEIMRYLDSNCVFKDEYII